ncbi:all-trans-retinol 13,14-reductase [Procambarus clarkii]|uniref:all-trans-retinol 13,14-reductase n=1 Tax=Procambarus clarkii TaxID=6728 RepID=UPI001E67018D|nr:all-trans-retinol 13,14-reductase-like [Procambarus clarkii]
MGLISLLIVLALLLGFGKKIIKFIASRICSPNPFKKNTCTNVKAKVTDQKQRDAVLKQGFSLDKVPENLDAIVIGSGVGGLSVAALMAKSGKKVLVLEQHDQAGGCCHTYIDKGYEFDVGIHYVGEMATQTVCKTYLDQITNGQLEWAPMRDDYDDVVFAEKDQEPRKYPVFSGRGRWKQYLKKTFPADEKNIDKFFKMMDEVHPEIFKSAFVKFIPLWAVWLLRVTGLLKCFTSFYEWENKTCKEIVWGLTKDQELRDILCYGFGDFGTPPSMTGFPMQTYLYKHFEEGSSYPVGGASEIPFHIIPVIEAAGGKVLVRAEVTQIIIDGKGRACGVKVRKGKELVNVTAPLIISDAGVHNTFERLLPLEVASSSRFWPLVQTAKHGPGSLYVFVGMNCDADELDILKRKNAWVFTGSDIDKVTVDYWNLSREEALDAEIPHLFVSFPSTKDPDWKQKFPCKTTMALVILMPYRWMEEWENKRVMKRGDEYESIKKTFAHKALEKACELFPSIRDHIDYVNIGTPLSNRYYFGAQRGEVCGLDHTTERFSLQSNAILRPQTDVPGLYLTGQDICCGGLAGAMWGGLLCASSILLRNVKSDLERLHQIIQDEKKAKAKFR